MPGADTLSSFAAPPIVPVIITALITSTWRNVIIGGNSEAQPSEIQSSSAGANGLSGLTLRFIPDYVLAAAITPFAASSAR
jgi:hypothetical protein